MKKNFTFKNRKIFSFLVIALLMVTGGKAWGQKTYDLVTSSTQLVVGAKYLLAGYKTTATNPPASGGHIGTNAVGWYALGYQKTNNRDGIFVVSGTTTPPTSLQLTPATSNADVNNAFEITLNGTSAAWVLYDAANSSNLGPAKGTGANNYLIKSTFAPTYTISIAADSKVTMTCYGSESNTTTTAPVNRNIVRFNAGANGTDPLFASYGAAATGIVDVYLYVERTACSTPPNLGGTTPSSQTVNSVTLSTAFTNTYDCTVTEYGFVYSKTSATPTIADTKKTSTNLSSGSFSATATGLDCGATYNVCSYAIYNTSDVAYGNVGTFTTSTCPPNISAANSLTFGPVDLASASNDLKQLTITGTNLTTDISYSISGTNAAFFTPSSGTLTQSGGSYSGKLAITYTPTAAGNHTATLTLTSGTAAPISVSLNGSSVINCNVPAPTALQADPVGATSFTANWTGTATNYLLNVYTKTINTIQELVQNGGFETGDATGWSGTNFEWHSVVNDNTNAHSGNYYSKRTTPAGTGNTSRIEQDIATEIGKTYTLSFWYKDYAAADANGFKNYSLINASTASSYIEGTTPAKLPAAANWTKYEKTFVATATTMKISLRAYEPVSIDDISLTTGTTTVTNTPISGSPFTVTGNSKEITGLSSGTTYYYTVKAYGTGYCATEISNNSNEIEVTTATAIVFDAKGAVNKWIQVSAPFASVKLSDFRFNNSPRVAGETLNADGSWTAIKATDFGTTTFNAGDGFLYMVNGADPQLSWNNGLIYFNFANFTLNDDNVSLVTKEIKSGNKFCFTGNPYNEPISFSALVASNPSFKSLGYYEWDGSKFQLKTDNLPVWKGIIVENLESQPQGFITFNKATMKVGIPAPTMALNAANSKITIESSNVNGNSSTSVYNNTNGGTIVGNYDMSFLNMGENQNVQLYTSKIDINGTMRKLALNTINSDNTTIPVGVFTTYNGDLTLTFTGMDSYDCTVTLLDNDVSTDITGLPSYSYETTVAGSNANRFALLLYPKIPTVSQSLDNINIRAFVLNNKINVVSTEDLQNIKIFSISGAQIASINASGKSFIVNSKLPSGIYLVKISTANKTTTQKIVLK